jgi:hypothetical protein
MEDRRFPFWGWYQWVGGGLRKIVKEGKYGENNMYSCMKMEQLRSVGTVLRSGGGWNKGQRWRW